MNRHRWQSWLTFVGVMLGVAMVVGVDLANSSARRAFALSLDSIAGSVTHQIIGGPKGVPESVYTGLRTELALRSSLPMVIGQATIKRFPRMPFIRASKQSHSKRSGIDDAIRRHHERLNARCRALPWLIRAIPMKQGHARRRIH